MARSLKEIDAVIRKSTFMWPDSLIHLFKSGSAAHGATGLKPSDTDISGVYIQPVERVLGISQMRVDDTGYKKFFDPDVQVWTTGDDDRKNNSDDVDLNFFSLRKWANMAATGNSNALQFLFVPNMLGVGVYTTDDAPYQTVWDKHIMPNTQHFISKRAGFHFQEFSKAMLNRLKGGEGSGKHGQRPELIEEFGYDTKAAMHLVRVLDEGKELMDTGKITYPRPNVELLKRIRGGEFDFVEIEFMYDQRLQYLQEAQAASKLPEELDRTKISLIITDAQIDFWGWRK